mgnify:CR=1 FL=1
MSMMGDLSFDEFEERLQEHYAAVRAERDLRAFRLPNILDDPEYFQYLTMEYNFTDRVN